MDPQNLDLTEIVVLLGAVGASAMAVVEALKLTWLGRSGLDQVKAGLGADALVALKSVYGDASFGLFLEGAWRKGAGELESTLSSGLRLAVFSETNFEPFVRGYGEPEPAKLAAAIRLLRDASPEGPATPELSAARARLARFEAAVDARVRAAVSVGSDRYKYTMQWAAGLLCVIACTAVAKANGQSAVLGAVLGLLAVPIAPVTKDVTTFLTSVRDVFKNKAAAG